MFMKCFYDIQMAKELDAILDHGEAQPAVSCTDDNGSVSYLDQIICPIYETMAAVSASFSYIMLFIHLETITLA